MGERRIEPVGVSWIVTTLFLVGGTFFEVVVVGELGLVGLALFVSQAAYWIARVYWGRGS